ncbi:hypothetical protein Bpfe_023457, partial [Biomphalaria pfeifferi]
ENLFRARTLEMTTVSTLHEIGKVFRRLRKGQGHNGRQKYETRTRGQWETLGRGRN